MQDGDAPVDRTSKILNSLCTPLLHSSSESVRYEEKIQTTNEPFLCGFFDTKQEGEEQGTEAMTCHGNESHDEKSPRCGSTVVDLDEMAKQMCVEVEDLLLALHVSSGDDFRKDPLVRSRLSQSTEETVDNTKSSHNTSSNSAEPSFDMEEALPEFRWHLSRMPGETQLLFLDLQNIAGSMEEKQELEEEQLIHEPREEVDTGAPGSGTVSLVLLSSSSLHGSASHVVSATSEGYRTRTSSPLLPPEIPARRIRFGSRIVTKVSVYSVDSEVYIGVRFCQHWSSWAALLTGFFLECLFEVHLLWFTHIGGATSTETVPIAHWVYTYRAILSVICCLVWLLFPVWRNHFNNHLAGAPFDRHGIGLKGFLVTLASSLCFTSALAAMVLARKEWDSSLFFTATVMHCIWILLYRLLQRQMVFLIESCGALFLVVGNVLCNVESMRVLGFRGSLYGNLLMTVASILFATSFLLVAYGRQRGECGTMGFTVSISVLLFVATFIVGVCCGYPMKPGVADSIYAGFQRQNAVKVFFLAAEDLLSNVMYIYALFHLDVLSVSACFSLKVAVIPFLSHWFVWNHVTEVPYVVQKRWGPFLFLGACVVAVAAAIVIYFASVRRRFAARRLFHTRGLRKVPDPYRRKSRRRHNGARRMSPTAMTSYRC